MTKGNSGKSKGQKRDEIERKRDERSRRRSMKKEREIQEYCENDENFVSFKNQLEAIGLKIKDILGDGNCLFRALGDQLNGDHTAHAYHRRNTVQYIKDHRDDFEPFMEDGITFEKHLKELSKLGTYGGNDSIVAFARNNGVNVVIHQLNNPRWVIHGSEFSKNPQVMELHLAYHNGEHYSSVRRLSDPDKGPAWEYHSRNSMLQSSTNKEKETPSKNNNNKTKKKKKQEKKIKQTSQEPTSSSECIVNGEDDMVTIVASTTGCQDIQLIAETLADNFYDVDAAISYILQFMSVMEDQDVDTPSNKTDSSETIPSAAKTSEERNTPIDSTAETSLNTSDINSLKNMDINTENVNSKTEGNLVKECNNSTTNLKDSNTQENVQKFVGNLKETLSELDPDKSKNDFIKQGAKPKDTTKKNSSKTTPHLSNRQRKDLAKQEKKKRREERRKDEDQQNEINTNNANSLNTDTSNSLVSDLGAVSI